MLHKISQGNLCYEIWQIFTLLLALIGCLSLSNSFNNVEGVKIVMLDGYLGIGPFVSCWPLGPHSTPAACLMLYTMPGLIQDTVHLATHPTLN